MATNVYLGQGQAAPNNVLLRDPTQLYSAPITTVAALAGILSAWAAPDPTFIGGQQPFAPKASVAAFASTVAPPFVPARSMQPMLAALAAWGASDPIPTLPRQLNPSITAVRVDNPPIGNLSDLQGLTLGQYFPAADPQPTLPRYLSPSIPGQSVDSPPSGIIGLLRRHIAARSWNVDDPLPTLPRYVQQPVVVAPAFVPYAQAWLGSVVASWATSDPAPTLPRLLNASLTAVPVNNPPFASLSDLQGLAVGQYFPPPDPQPTLTAKLVQGTAVASTYNPYARPWLSAVLSAWTPPDPAPTLPRWLNASLTAVPVNNPPFGGLADLQGLVVGNYFPPADPLPTLARFAPQAAAVVAVSTTIWLTPVGASQNNVVLTDPTQQPPVGPPAPFIPSPHRWLTTVLAAWQPSDPAPTLSARFIILPPPVVSFPPPINRGWMQNVLNAWIPSDPMPVRGTAVFVRQLFASAVVRLSATAERSTNLKGIYGLTAVGQNVTMRLGDSRTLVFSIRAPDGTNPTFISPTCSFVITANYTGGPDYVTKTGLLPGISSAGAWSVSVPLRSSDTSAIPVGKQSLQLRLTDVDGSELTLAVGFFTMQPIRPTPPPPLPPPGQTFYFLGF